MKKALFVLKIFKCLHLLVMYKKGLIGKLRLNSKFMTSQPVKQTIAIDIFPNILRSKDDQTMKFGQLIERNIRTFFLKNHTQNVVQKLVADPFLKNQN